MPPLISAIVVSYDSQPFPDTSLASLFNQLRFFDAEVILVNAGDAESFPAFSDQSENAALPVREIKSRVKGAPAAALNEGIKAADGKYLLLLNPGIALHPESLELMIDYIQSDRTIGMVVPQVVTREGAIIASCRRFPTHKDVLFQALGLHKIFPGSQFWNGRFMGDFSHQEIRRIEEAKGYAWLISSAAWKTVGPFDQNFLHDYYDTDWCRRLRNAGYMILFYPQAKVIAAGQENPEHLVRRRVSLFRLFDKHYDGVHHQFLNLLVGLVIYFTLPFQLIWRGLRARIFRPR